MSCGINPLKINAVFISHLHGDHVYGLFGLISTLGLTGRRTPLQIFAPRPFDEILAAHRRYFDTELPYEIQWNEVRTRRSELIYENKVLEVRSVPLRHRVPAAGFLFREKTPPLNVRKEAVARYGLGIAQCVAAKRGEEALNGSMTVNAWYKEWKATYKDPKGLTPKSLGMYDEKYNGYIKPAVGHMKLQSVRDVHLQRILNGRCV